jgi:integrase
VPILITAETVRTALADQRRSVQYEVVDERVPGLRLSVKALDCRWSVRARVRNTGLQRRWDLGAVCAGNEDVDGRICLATARGRASNVREKCRTGVNPDEIVAYYTGGREAVEARRQAAKPSARSWSWEEAKKRYSVHLASNNRQATKADYEKKLRLPELSRFAGRALCSITANEVAKVYADIHARSRSTGHGFRRVVKAFWTYLGDATRADETGVTIDLDRLNKIPDPRAEIGDPNTLFDPDDEQGDAPPEIELGRLLAISRCPGVLDPRIAYGVQLLLASVQRRRTVVGAGRNRFKRYVETPDEEAWYIPPYWRKSGSKRGQRYHLVPVVGWGAKAVFELDKLSDFEGSSGWLFPARGKDSVKPADDGLLNDHLEVMPGIDFSPHGVRYAFAEYGERDLGFSKSEAKLILDHLEGTDSDDVTGQFYSTNPAIARKRQMMSAWCEWLDKWAEVAVKEDPRLLDHDWLCESIYRNRYGEDCLQRRIALRQKLGTPLWGLDHKQKRPR